MDAKEVLVLITGANKAIALYKAVEEGVCHMWTVSAFQQHGNTLMVCDEDATLELRVRTVKYFKDMWQVHIFPCGWEKYNPLHMSNAWVMHEQRITPVLLMSNSCVAHSCVI